MDRLPEHAGALHRAVGHPVLNQPVAQPLKVRGHRAEGPELLAAPPARLADQDAAHPRLLMDIQPGTALMPHVHCQLLRQAGDRDAARKSRHCPACWPNSAATVDDPSQRRGPHLPSGVRRHQRIASLSTIAMTAPGIGAMKTPPPSHIFFPGRCTHRVRVIYRALPRRWAFCPMLQDLESGRRLEVPWLSGTVARLGAERGVATPIHRTIAAALAVYADGPPGAG
jgi:hypothetical protein